MGTLKVQIICAMRLQGAGGMCSTLKVLNVDSTLKFEWCLSADLEV